MGAPSGNKNAQKTKLFDEALRREIKQRDLTEGDGETLRKIAAAWVDKAIAGDPMIGKEIRDTLDGKPKQQTEISGDPDRPLTHRIERTIIDSLKPADA